MSSADDRTSTTRLSAPLQPGDVVTGRAVPTAAWLAGLALVAVAVYANSLFNGFALDDQFIIAENDQVHRFAGLRDIWLSPYWPHLGTQFGIYRPLVIFLFAVEWAVGGGQPWLFHAANVLLHAAVTILLFFLLKRLVSPGAAAIGALLFAVHSVHTEAVANVVGQAEIVSAAAILGACLVHASRPAGSSVGFARLLVLLALFLAALFTKESAVVLPGLLVVVDAATRRLELSRRGLLSYARGVAIPLIVLAAGFVGYSLFRLEALGGSFMGEDSGPQLGFLKEHRLLNAFRALPELLRLLFLPMQLSADYNPAVLLPVASFTPMAALGLLLLVALVVLAMLTPRLPAAGFPAAWFLVAIAPVSNLFFPIGILIAERTLYIPSVAVAALVAFAWDGLRVEARRSQRLLLSIAVGVWILALGVRTWVRNPDWATTSSILTSLVRDRPESYRSQWLLAGTFLEQGDRVRAAWHFQTAYRIYPHNSEFLTDYGEFLLHEGRVGPAVELLERANRMHPRILRSASLLAWVYLQANRYADALPLIDRLEELGTSRAVTMPLRAHALERLGRFGRSAAAWRVALRQPALQSWRNWGFLARNLAAAGDQQAALAAAQQARALAPDLAARTTIEQLIGAVQSGCYRSLQAETHSGSPPVPDPTRPSCDALGSWLAVGRPQTAMGSQNAMPAR